VTYRRRFLAKYSGINKSSGISPWKWTAAKAGQQWSQP
jgi:hypothetical protein